MEIPSSAPLTIALALAVGMAAQSLAKHLRVPGLVLLLLAGVAVGPDGANLVQPDLLGPSLADLVGFAVAVILFEGGMTLDLRHLRRQGRAVNQLITLGALGSLGIGALVASLLGGLPWRLALLFGTLVMVTGPTVVTPLLKQLRIKRRVAMVLEAEGVLIDAIGAVTATVALEVVVSPSTEEVALAVPTVLWRLAFGVGTGLAGGFLLALLLRFRGVIPERFTNTFTLAWSLLVFQVANATEHESGIAAVTIAGMVVGNAHVVGRKSLHTFKEELTSMLIALLFVLLVADVRLADVLGLGWRGALVAAGTIAIVRPVSVWLGTVGSDLSIAERILIGWIGPRGIVAAAVASLFAFHLEEAGVSGGTELRALVFLVIGATVLWSAATGGPVASLLDLRRKRDDGWMVVGGNALARLLARELDRGGAEVVLVDEVPDDVRSAEAENLRALLRDPLDPGSLRLAELDTRRGALGVTTSEEANYLFGEKSRLAVPQVRFPLALATLDRGVTLAMVHDFGGELLFGCAVDVERWAARIERDEVTLAWFRFTPRKRAAVMELLDGAGETLLPLLHRRRGHTEPVTDKTTLRRGSQIAVLVPSDAVDEVRRSLAPRFTPLEGGAH